MLNSVQSPIQQTLHERYNINEVRIFRTLKCPESYAKMIGAIFEKAFQKHDSSFDFLFTQHIWTAIQLNMLVSRNQISIRTLC